MADHAYPVEVQSDFLEKITKAKPVQALAELIWNGLDADATSVSVSFDYNALGAMSAVIVTDNGNGIPFSEAPEGFRRLGGSWKRPGAVTKGEGRFLHGQDGRGRFKAFSLGRFAEWDVTYPKGTELWTFKITMNASNIREVRISDEKLAPAGKSRGVTLSITELHKEHRSLTTETGLQELSEIFALYLADYRAVSVKVDTHQIDPDSVIALRHSVNLADIREDDKTHPARLEIIEWRATTNRALYLCNEKGFPLLSVDRRFHIGAFQFSAYLKSSFISKLQKDGTVELAEMNPAVIAVIDEAQQAIKSHFRNRAAQEARSVVDEWKSEAIYPYQGEPATHLETVERQVFDIVAVNMAQHASSEWAPFWANLKEGYDAFERTRVPPRVSVCDGHYQIRDTAPGEVGAPSPLGWCGATAAALRNLDRWYAIARLRPSSWQGPALDRINRARSHLASLRQRLPHLATVPSKATMLAVTGDDSTYEKLSARVPPPRKWAQVPPVASIPSSCSLKLASCRKHVAMLQQLAMRRDSARLAAARKRALRHEAALKDGKGRNPRTASRSR